MRTSTHSTISASRLLLLPLALVTLTIPSATASSKRGLSIITDSKSADWSLVTESSISWYWNWSPDPANSTLVSGLEFIPQIHDISNLDADITQVKTLTDSTHLMTFNEPDGSTSSGGTGISADDAAKAYIDSILPLRKSNGGQFLISHPAVTGSSQGLSWLSDFNTSCYKLEPKTGCPQDFITAHWYGDFEGLASWVGQLDDFYNGGANVTDGLKIWISEVALPKQSADTTVAMLNETLPYLDDLESVGGYAWFGMFREDDTNEFTGVNVALFDKSGGLTELGAEYLNAEGNTTFKAGQKGAGASGASGLAVGSWLALAVSVGWLLSVV